MGHRAAASDSATAIIVAGGSGRRMASRTPKQYLPLAGRPILARTLEVFDDCPSVDAIVLVVAPDDIDYCRKVVLSAVSLHKDVCLAAGGRERQDSVYNGLMALERHDGIAVIHDGVRPLVSPDHVEACIQDARTAGACILALPAGETLKRVRGRFVLQTLPRSDVWCAQTPQAFRLDWLLEGHAEARRRCLRVTDDAQLMELVGKPVRILPGSRWNIKITTPEDLMLAEAILASQCSGRLTAHDLPPTAAF
jgi:2-C-methyl-D-erythritol 4-phosphate cytidylyltransferase